MVLFLGLFILALASMGIRSRKSVLTCIFLGFVILLYSRKLKVLPQRFCPCNLEPLLCQQQRLLVHCLEAATPHFLVGGIDFSGTHLLALGGGSKVGTAKPCNYTAIGLGAETALAVLTARFLPGMGVKDAENAVMQALFRVIVESNDSTLNGSVFIIGLDSLVPSLNCVFRHGRGDSSKEFFFPQWHSWGGHNCY